MKKVAFSLSSAEISKAISELKRYSKWCEKKTTELTERLAIHGATIANIQYNGFMLDGAQEKPKISVIKKSNGYSVVAQGKSVCFIEFGAGVYAGQGYNGNHGDLDISPGSYSSSDDGSGEFAKFGSWHYKGKKYVGVIPGMAMLTATNDIKQTAEKIIEEVFNND